MERKNNDDNEIEARNNSNNDNYEYLKEQFQQNESYNREDTPI